jgi:hypothetical protein
VREFLIRVYNIFVENMNLQEVVEAIYSQKSETSKKIVVIGSSGGNIKTYLLFFIVKSCNTF